MEYKTEFLDIRERVERLNTTPEIMKILRDDNGQRKVWENSLNVLSNDIINSDLNGESKEFFLKSVNSYKNSLKEIERTENDLGKYVPYLILAGIAFFVGYQFRGMIDSAGHKITENIMKGLYEEMKGNG